MSAIYSNLKLAEVVRQNKFSQALQKSTLEQPSVKQQGLSPLIKPPVGFSSPEDQSFKLKVILAFLVLLVLGSSFVFFLALRKPSPPVKREIKPAVNLIKPVQLKPVWKHRISHHKKIIKLGT